MVLDRRRDPSHWIRSFDHRMEAGARRAAAADRRSNGRRNVREVSADPPNFRERNAEMMIADYKGDLLVGVCPSAVGPADRRGLPGAVPGLRRHGPGARRVGLAARRQIFVLGGLQGALGWYMVQERPRRSTVDVSLPSPHRASRSGAPRCHLRRHSVDGSRPAAPASRRDALSTAAHWRSRASCS